MAGALLRSGSLTEFCPLGAVGKPVYTAASQLRAAIRRRTNDATAEVFAIPKQNEQGDIIDWYAPVAGAVVPWSAATAEERAEAKDALEAARRRLAELSASLLNVDQDDKKSTELQVFAKLLAQATKIPSDEHIYLVEGKPAITFWGFHPLDAPPGHDVIGNLDVGTPAIRAPSAAAALASESDGGDAKQASPANPAVVEQRQRRLWWWLPLLLLLLLLLLLIGLKSCGVQVPFVPQLTLPLSVEKPEQPAQSSGHEPWLGPDGRPLVYGPDNRPVYVGRDGRPVVYGPDGEAVTVDPDGAPLATTQPPIDPAAGAEPADITDGTDLPDPSDSPRPPPAPDPTPAPDPADVTDPTTAGEPAEMTGPTGIPEGSGAPLTIPDGSVQAGDTSFLDGGWRSDTGLQDTSGYPVELGYDFKSDGGNVTLQRSIGDQKETCTGPANPAMQDGRLVITQGEIRCPDGTTFHAPRVVCKVGAGGRADCEGVNEDGSTFPVSITR